MRRGREAVEFRASLLIRASVLLALMLWVGVGVAAAVVEGVPAGAFVPIAFFVLFFSIFVFYYWSMAYVVDEYGVTYRGATDFEHFGWEEITQVRGSEIPMGGYYISTKTGGFVLSNVIKGREALVEMIIARAGLFPGY